MSRLRLLFALALSAAFFGCATGGSGPKEKSLLHLQLGTAHLTQGNYPLALQELLAAEKLDPRNPIVQNNLGLAYFVRDRLDLAEAKIRRAIQLDPKYTDAKNNLGKVLTERGRFSEAIEVLTEASQDLTYTSPQKVLANLGVAQFRAKNFAAARGTLLKVLQMQGQDCLLTTLYGRSLLETEDFERARVALDQAIGQCKGTQFDEPYYFSAVGHMKAGDSERARARLQELIEKFPAGDYIKEAQRLLRALN